MSKSKKWKPENYVKCYELARSGMTDSAVARALGYTPAGLLLAAKSDPAIRDALDRGRNGSDDSRHADFRDYVYHRLPPELQEAWDRINLCDESPVGYVRVRALTDALSSKARQHLYLYALAACGFNVSEASRKLCLSLSTLRNWAETDPDFAALVDEFHFHKKTYFEAHLIRRVAEGDSACTIFANRTLNADWGYREKKQVDHTGDVNHSHQHAHAHLVVPVADLGLPPADAESLLDAMQRRLGIREGEDPAEVPAEVKAR